MKFRPDGRRENVANKGPRRSSRSFDFSPVAVPGEYEKLDSFEPNT